MSTAITVSFNPSVSAVLEATLKVFEDLSKITSKARGGDYTLDGIDKDKLFLHCDVPGEYEDASAAYLLGYMLGEVKGSVKEYRQDMSNLAMSVNAFRDALIVSGSDVSFVLDEDLFEVFERNVHTASNLRMLEELQVWFDKMSDKLAIIAMGGRSEILRLLEGISKTEPEE